MKKIQLYFSLGLLILLIMPESFAQEQRAVAKRATQDFKYQQSQLDNAVVKASDMLDDMFRRLEEVEVNQEDIISCARQDAPIDPNSYSVWDKGRDECVTVTRDCVPHPENEIESRELVFIFDASSSMKEMYEPPKVDHNCQDAGSRWQEFCGSRYYPSFKPTPVESVCGRRSYSVYCDYCGDEPVAPKEEIVIGTEIDGEGIERDVMGWRHITEGPEWEKYLREKEKYDVCVEGNETSQCIKKYQECKAKARVDYEAEIEQYELDKQAWRDNVYEPYKTCRHDQYSQYLSCVNEFNSIWNAQQSEPRIDAAKAAMKEAVRKAPTFVELGLVVFNGCQNVKNHGFYLDADRLDLINAIEAVDATGSTPLVDSMIVATENMKIKSEEVNAEGYIVLVTDGEDTCVSKDSETSMKAVCDTAKALKKQNDGLVINVMDMSNNSKLSCISEYTGGVYASVKSENTMLSSIIGEMSKISDIPEYCYAPEDYDFGESP